VTKSHIIENWCIWLKAERNGNGDSDETVIMFNLHANDDRIQKFCIKGAIEWNAFVQAILEIDRWHEGDESWVETFKRQAKG
jgi:hypothetical protein